MKQTALIVSVFTICLCFSACQSGEGWTPETDTSELWPAGVSYVYDPSVFNIDYEGLYPDSMLYGYINRQGKMVIAPQFISAGTFSCGFAPARITGPEKKYNPPYEPVYIDTKGNVHHISGFPGSLEELSHFNSKPFYYNSAMIWTQTTPGTGSIPTSFMLNNSLHIVSEALTPGTLQPMMKDGLAVYTQRIGQSGSYAVYELSHYNKSGRKALETKSALGGDANFKDGYEIVRFMRDTTPGAKPDSSNVKYCIVDTKGHIWYEDSHMLSNLGQQRFLRKYDTLYSADQFEVIDKYGHLLGSEDFQAPEWQGPDMLYLVRHTWHEQVYGIDGVFSPYYYINQNGKQAFPRSFDSAYPFWEGYAVVGLQFDHEVINEKGETVLRLEENETASSVHNGLILTTKGNSDASKEQIRYAYKDLSGRIIYSWTVTHYRSGAPAANSPSQHPSDTQTPSDITTFPEGQFILGH